jgi:KDO2-lipid IV(A) lauroyltransferase
MADRRANTGEWASALGARALLALFGLLPLERASRLGGWLARRLGPLTSVHRIADRQMSLALPEMNVDARRRCLAGMWDNLGRVLAELSHLSDIRLGENLEVVGDEHLDIVRTSGRPAIFISAHYGNWELVSHAAALLSAPLVLVYRAANNPLVEDLLQSIRSRPNLEHVPKGVRAARALLQALQTNRSLGILVDQKLNSGIAVPFFGHDAMTAPAPAELALRSNSPIIPIRVERLHGTQFRISIEAPIILVSTGDRDKDVLNGLLRINAVLERWIRERPDHWFWVHKRWPRH